MNKEFYSYTSTNPNFNALMAMIKSGEPDHVLQRFINSMPIDDRLYCMEMLVKTPPLVVINTDKRNGKH